MPRPKPAEIDRNAIFQSVRGAAIITGFSAKAIYAGCQNGSIPAIRQGSDWRVNIPKWLEVLDAESMQNLNQSAFSS